MNRRKKSIQIVKSRIKKAKAKLAPQSKPKYVSKADRDRLKAEAESNQDGVIVLDE